MPCGYQKLAGALGVVALVVATGGLAGLMMGIDGLSSVVVGGVSALTAIGDARNASDAKNLKKKMKSYEKN